MFAIAFALALIAASASADLLLAPIAGTDGFEGTYGSDVFHSNRTGAELQLSGTTFPETPLGGSGGPSIDTVLLTIEFLGDYQDETAASFSSLALTAAFQPGDASFDYLRVFDPGNPTEYVDIAFGAFVDANDLGLPPDEPIHGLTVNGLDDTLMAGVDLGAGLERDADAPVPPSLTVGVQVYNAESGSKLRLDAFGLSDVNPHGLTVTGNNAMPYAVSSAGGESHVDLEAPASVVPEPATSFFVMVGAAALHAWRRRRAR